MIWKPSLEPWKPSPGTFNESRVVDYQYNSIRIPCRSKYCFLGWFWTFFGQFRQRATLRSGNLFLSAKTYLYLGSCNENTVVDYQCVTSGVPCQIKKWIILGDFGCFLTNSDQYCGPGAFLWSRGPLYLEPQNRYLGYFNENKWLMTNVTAVHPPARAEKKCLGWF